ncbi:hypothetical protein J3B02_005601 [Coemansia erecta]|uniref:Uncharacterized protein n=1 Tax=Coemansia asiatica TaxID=1052880 RepID=A0A9W7XGW0_9FUNG|nr:hypothetical protein LPJ64_005850 [Coemansia asiatica]KAJ2842370.1 hypothetical protein J3B02_005601 [Coemansia erecta]KAJ2883226.1 hypothetical protein FB639_002218 [Coemansia asiatica]
MLSNYNSQPVPILGYSSMPTVQFSSKAVTVTAIDETDLEGTISIDDIPDIHQLPLARDIKQGAIKQTIICDEIIAHEIQPRQLSNANLPRQMFQICGRSIDNKRIFPFDQFSACIHVAATHMVQNLGNQNMDKFGHIGFWSPRIKLLYARGLAAYKEACLAGDPSMIVDDIYVMAQISIKPFLLSLTFCAFPFSSMRTCQVRVARGTRPKSFMPDFHLSNDPSGLTRLITPPISDVILVNPQTQRLSEGLLSNFFVTYFTPQQKPSTPEQRKILGNYLLVCAPLETIHANSMVDALWSICKRDGITVSFAGANLTGALKKKWSGAFIVNSAFCLLPIDTMYLTDKYRTLIEFGKCPLVSHLQDSLLEMFHNTEPAYL